MSSVLQDLLPAHMGLASIAVLIVCFLVLAALGTNAAMRWKSHRDMRRYGRGP
jgi:hypothetical protein